MFRLFFVTLLFVVFFPFALYAEEHETVRDFPFLLGQKITGSLEFDCTIRLIAPIAQTENILFIHYLVSADAISYDIVWAEPSWKHLNFPYPPFGMSMYADKSRFLLYHSWNNVRWEKNIAAESRGVFQSTCNTYPLEDAGFAYKSFLERQLVKKDEQFLIRSKQTQQKIPLNDGTRRKMQFYLAAGRPDYTQFELYLENPPQYFSQALYYNEKGNLDRLAAETAEHPIPVSGFEIQAKTSEFPDGMKITQLPAQYHKGGRLYLTAFQKVKFGDKEIDLPLSIKVTDRAVPTTLLRKVKFSNFQMKKEAVVAENIGTFFSSKNYFVDEQKFRQLSQKYWLKNKDIILPDEIEWLTQFSGQCLERFKKENQSSYRLQFLYMSICSDLLTDNIKRIEQETFAMYYSELQKEGFEIIADKGKEQFINLCKEWHKAIQIQ